jgi:hypothetical protein
LPSDPDGLVTGISREAVVENWSCAVPYGCKLEDLLAILHDRAPAKADVVALQRRRVEDGLLSVGLKIHYLGNGRQFFSLVPLSAGRRWNFRVIFSALSAIA